MVKRFLPKRSVLKRRSQHFCYTPYKRERYGIDLNAPSLIVFFYNNQIAFPQLSPPHRCMYKQSILINVKSMDSQDPHLKE